MSTSNSDIKEAMAIYDRNEQRLLEEERLREQQKATEYAEQQAYYAQQEAYYAEQAYHQQASTQSSSGGGGFFETAAAVAVGSKIANRGNDGSGRQNLFGSVNCGQAKRNIDPGWSTCGACPQGRYCTQKGNYKVGSRTG